MREWTGVLFQGLPEITMSLKQTGAVAALILLIVFLTAVLPPVALSRTDAKRGAKLFAKLTCASCHPGGGNTINPRKPLKGPAFQQKFAQDAVIAAIVRAGIYGTAMPGFDKEHLSDGDLSDIIAYIRSLTPRNMPAGKAGSHFLKKGK